MSGRIANIYGSWINRLARVTTSGRRIRELDGLRFIAIITVFVQHVLEVMTDRWRQSGAEIKWDSPTILVRDWRIGVQLFFVISGFILATPFAAQHMLGARKVSLKAYYWRRITRLEPPYLLALLLCFLTLVFYWGQSAKELAPHLLASALYVHNIVYHATAAPYSWINPVAWSLEIEVQFYVVAPLLACVFLIRSKPARRATIVAIALVLAQTYKYAARAVPSLPETLLNHLPFFLMGFLLADIFLIDWREEPKSNARFDAIALPGWLLLPLWFQQHRLPATLFPYILLLLCWSSFRSVFVRKLLASSFIMTTGGMCYSIYLLHLPLLQLFGQYSPAPLGTSSVLINLLMYSLIWGVPTLGVSILFFMAIEKPCMRKDWPQRLWARLNGRPMPRTVGAPTAPLPQNQPVP